MFKRELILNTKNCVFKSNESHSEYQRVIIETKNEEAFNILTDLIIGYRHPVEMIDNDPVVE